MLKSSAEWSEMTNRPPEREETNSLGKTCVADKLRYPHLD